MSVATDPLATAVTTHRVQTARLPRLRALCGRETPTGLCHLSARHGAVCVAPPARIRRPGQW